MTYLLCLLPLLATAAAIDISFSSSTYYSKVATIEDPLGKVVIRTQLVYDRSLVRNFTNRDYNLYRTDGRYFSVDRNGVVTLRLMLPYRRLYIFQISLLYTLTLNDNTTQSGFLSADARIQAIGPVYFDNSTYRVVVSTGLQPNDQVYNFRQHVVYNSSAFRSVYFEFDYVYSSYFSMEASTGMLYVRRALYPATFSVRIEIEYDVTLLNGTVVSDDDYVYASIVAIGCRGEEEIKAFWPDTYPCSAFKSPCTDFDNGIYFNGGSATRVCDGEGNWLSPDYSTCSVKEGTESFALIWMTFSTTSGTYVLSQLTRIITDIGNLFPRGSVSNIAPVSAFRSNAQYGFMMGFKMDVNTTLTQSGILSAQSALNRAYRFGSMYLRSSRTIQGRGLRFFTGVASTCGAQQTTDSDYFEVCSGSKCNCTTNTINSNGTCSDVDLRRKEDENPTTVPRNETEPSYLSLNATDYYGQISAFAPKGTYILTVGYNTSGGSLYNISNFHYDLSGYYSDYFKIDRRLGTLTINAELTSRLYSFDVSFFYTVNYKNGTIAHNYTESDIFITARAGIGFNASTIYITMDADYILNDTVIVNMMDYMIQDDIFILDTLTFYYISDTRFSVDSETGEVKIVRDLDPLRLHYARVYVRYNGTINNTEQRYYASTTSALIRIYTLGCFEHDTGNLVWPASHVCTTAVHNCYDVDHAFNQSGTVTRYCSNTGQWQDPDYSQCSFTPGTKPFIHLYLTFYTLRDSYILSNLETIVRSGNSLLARLNVNGLIPYSVKESVVRYGMVVVLRAEVPNPNNTMLTSINSTIASSRTFARIRLQTAGNGIQGFIPSDRCEYPTYPSEAWNITKFAPVCRTGDGIYCDCDPMEPTVGVCNVTTPPTGTTPVIIPTTQPTPVGLNVSAVSVSNTSVQLQWSDDTPGVMRYRAQYNAVIRYNITTGQASYVDSNEVVTTDTSYMFTLLNPSTQYTFTVTSYTAEGESSTMTLDQNTMEGRRENPAFVELRFTSRSRCNYWDKDGQLVSQVVNAVVENIVAFCKCRYTSEYVKVWYTTCRYNPADETSDVILIAQLMPTNLYESSYMVKAMSDWVNSGLPGIPIEDELLRIDQKCKVQLEHPFGSDCSEMTSTPIPASSSMVIATPSSSVAATTSPSFEPPTAAAQNQFSTNNDDDNNSAGAAVGGVIAGLVIICITVVVLVVVIMLLRRREKGQTQKKSDIPVSSYNADTMKVQLAEDF